MFSEVVQDQAFPIGNRDNSVSPSPSAGPQGPMRSNRLHQERTLLALGRPEGATRPHGRARDGRSWRCRYAVIHAYNKIRDTPECISG